MPLITLVLRVRFHVVNVLFKYCLHIIYNFERGEGQNKKYGFGLQTVTKDEKQLPLLNVTAG